jgi:outer membrane immunogenic protein
MRVLRWTSFAASVLISTAVASAADLRRQPVAPVMPAIAAFSWTGAYIGVNAGYAFGESRTRVGLGGQWAIESAALQNRFAGDGGGKLRPNSFIGGIQAGYNVQMGSLVFGIEGDVNFLDLRKNQTGFSAGVPSYTFTRRVDTDWLITLRPRLGMAFNRTLVYATGGLALAEVKNNWSVSSSGGYLKSSSSSDFRAGWTIGAGVEHAFTNNWTAKLEYLYTDLGRSSKASGYLAGSTFVAPPYAETIRSRLTFHTIRAGINYKF